MNAATTKATHWLLPLKKAQITIQMLMAMRARSASMARDNPGSAPWLPERPSNINMVRKANGETRRKDPKSPRARPEPGAIRAWRLVWKSRTKAVRKGNRKKAASRARSEWGAPGICELARSWRVAGAVAKKNIME